MSRVDNLVFGAISATVLGFATWFITGHTPADLLWWVFFVPAFILILIP